MKGKKINFVEIYDVYLLFNIFSFIFDCFPFFEKLTTENRTEYKIRWKKRNKRVEIM